MAKSNSLKVGDPVWAKGPAHEGPGTVECLFASWMGDQRYVVAHRPAGGRGMFYLIYEVSQLTPHAVDTTPPEASDVR